MANTKGWKNDLSGLRSLQKEVKAILAQEVKNTAVATREAAVDEAPIKTGALKASAYITWRDSNGRLYSHYPEAIEAAKRLNPRAVARGQIEPELTPSADGQFYDGMAWAAVHFPLSYAGILIDGFPHVRLGIDIPANDFLQRAIDRTQAQFVRNVERRLKVALKSLEDRK